MDIPLFCLSHAQEEQLSLFDTHLEERSNIWLRNVVERMGAPKQLENIDLARADLEQTESLLRDLFTWHKYREDFVQSVLEQVVARLRYIQEECPGSLDRKHPKALFIA